MPTNNERKTTLDEIREFLGPPPLMQGESEEVFWKWVSVFADEYQPESFSDWLEVHDYAVKQWEQNRLQRSNSALIEAKKYAALKSLISLFHEDPFAVSRIAWDFAFGDNEQKEKAAERIKTYGITDDQILAEAIKLCANALVAFDRMDNYRTNSKRSARKGFERRSEARLKQSDQLNSGLQPGATGDQQSELKPPNLN